MLAAFFSVFPARFDELATDNDARSFLAGKHDQDPSRFLFAAQTAHGIGPSATKRSKTKNPTAPRARFREELWRDLGGYNSLLRVFFMCIHSASACR